MQRLTNSLRAVGRRVQAQCTTRRCFSSNGTQQQTSATSRLRGPVSWASLALTSAVGGGLLWYFNDQREQLKKQQQDTKEGAAMGKPLIGGSFKLTNQDGKPTKSVDFLGKWVLIYFGFTYCPDICPNELQKLTDAVRVIDESVGEVVQPLFISIDPERDTPEQLKEYLADWHPRFIGLTGSPDEVAEVAKKFRVFYTKAHTGDGPNEYLVDHSIIMYLLNPAGEFTAYYGKNTTKEELAQKITNQIKSFGG